MSAPVLGGEHSVSGVIQISRKSCDRVSPVQDFTDADLERLEAAARIGSRLMMDVEVAAGG
jgi:hypothetical protein